MKRPSTLLIVLSVLGFSAPVPRALAASFHSHSRAALQVRIEPTLLPEGSSSIDIGPTLWSVQGFDLRLLLARAYGVDAARIDLQAEAPAERFDVSMPLTGAESDEEVQIALRRAIQERFQLSAALETRVSDVYVLRAPQGAGVELRPSVAMRVQSSEEEPGGEAVITVAGRLCPGISSAAIAAQSASVGELAGALEDELNRPIVNETNLQGKYDFTIPEYSSQAELLQTMQERLGLVMTLERRPVALLAVRSKSAAVAEFETGM